MTGRLQDRHSDSHLTTFWACCCCDGEWPTAAQASDEDGCGDGWIVRFVDSEDGRRRLAHYRETYRSDLLK